jgi:hypothetical protein
VKSLIYQKSRGLICDLFAKSTVNLAKSVSRWLKNQLVIKVIIFLIKLFIVEQNDLYFCTTIGVNKVRFSWARPLRVTTPTGLQSADLTNSAHREGRRLRIQPKFNRISP